MTPPSHYAVQGPDHAREVHEPAPVAQQDDRFPRRSPSGGSRRRRQRKETGRSGRPPPTAPAIPGPRADPESAPTPHAPSDGEDHAVDALA